MSIFVSLASLVKNNNGFFKSEKQATFLLSHCVNGVYFVEGNSRFCARSFECDSKGVLLVKVHAKKPYVAFNRVNQVSKEISFKIAEDARDTLKAEMIIEAEKVVNLLKVKFEGLGMAEDAPSFEEIEKQELKGKKSFIDALSDYRALERELYSIWH